MGRHKTAASQLGITSGIRQDRSDFIFEPRQERSGRGSQRRGKLWILTEPAAATGGAGAAAKLVMETVEEEYYRSPAPSITTALEDAVRAANRLLHDYNSGAPLHKQAYLGLSCAVISGKDVYLAQVQPARAIVVHKGVPRALPDGMPKREEELTPLGLDAEVSIEMSRSPFTSGDSITLLSSGLSQMITRAEDEYGLSYKDHSGAVEHLYHAAARNNLLDEHAVVIEEQVRVRRDYGGRGMQALGREWLQNARSKAPGTLKGATQRLSLPSFAAAKGEAGERRLNFILDPKRIKSSLFSGAAGGAGATSRFRIGSTIIGVLLLVALAGGLGWRAYAGYQRNAQLASLLAAAEAQRQEARGKPTEAAIQHLQSAREYLADARRIEPTHAKIRSELRLLDADWEVVHKVVKIGNVTALTKLGGYKKGSASQLVVAQNKALILNRATGSVRFFDIKRKRGAVLEPDGGAKFVGISWRSGGALMLDAKGRLWDYDYAGDAWSNVKLKGAHQWSKVIAFDVYGDRAYVALKDRSEVLEYDLQNPSRARVLKSPVKREPLQPAGLGADGGLWVIGARDDSLWKLVNGKVSRRLWIDAQPPVEQAHGLSVLDTNKNLYLLDKNDNRVLQVAPNGQLRAQFQFSTAPLRLRAIDAVYADEKAGALWVVSGDTLYSAKLPGTTRKQ